MSHLPLIFQVVFEESELKTIDSIRLSLADLIIEVNEISVCNRKLLGIELSRVVLDLREILSCNYRNGYKWNSYVLRMAILKLSYIYEVLKAEDCVKHSKLMISISKVYILLSEILVENFNRTHPTD